MTESSTESKNDSSNDTFTFADLNLQPALNRALEEVGYESPSPIQAKTIPHLLDGRDLVGQAQTGTGKTAAFALPLLERLDLAVFAPQVLVLAPTRELAIQVAEAFKSYARFLPDFHVLPIYGGQGYGSQLHQLKRGPHVIVGTPGRVMDHIRRGSLKLDTLQAVVLDEADEMLRMGFIDDVEWILDQTPAERQVALFSATMPQAIRRIAQNYLNDPVSVTIQVKTANAAKIRQRYWMVSGLHKLDALTRILEGEEFDGIIIFVRTRSSTTMLADKLEARGYAAEPLSGDVAQAQRERTVERLKSGKIDILVATDVAARGLDVDRISHVINFDIPTDTEAYIHRIGRTGRAGREGDAILFVAPRERRMLRSIEKATQQRIELMSLPTREAINDARVARFKDRISDTLATEDLGFFTQIVEEFRAEHNVPAIEVAAALARMAQGDEPMLIHKDDRTFQEQAPRSERAKDSDRPRPEKGQRQIVPLEPGMERFRLDVGYSHRVKPGQIVGAIANEIDLDAKHIGRIIIGDEHTYVDLPEGMPDDLFEILRDVWVVGRAFNIEKVAEDEPIDVPDRDQRSNRDDRRGGGGGRFRGKGPRGGGRNDRFSSRGKGKGGAGRGGSGKGKRRRDG